MRLNPTAFNRHLANIGQKVDWRQSFACTCKSTTSGASDTKCPHCAGKGHLWSPGKVTTCGVAGQSTQAKWAVMGQWVDGDVVVTVPGDSVMWDVAQFDRVTLRNASDRFSIALTRGAVTERLLHSVRQIDRVFWLAPVTKAIVEGGIPSFDARGHLTWSAGEPPAGTSYSITGTKFPDYWVFGDMPSSRNEHSGSRLPRRVVLRRWDLWGR